MTLTRRDLGATTLVVLTVLTYLTTHQGWDVWLIGDSHRWATVVILALGITGYVLDARSDGFPGLKRFVLISLTACVLAAIALLTGSLTPLSMLVVLIVAGWAITTLRHFTGQESPRPLAT